MWREGAGRHPHQYCYYTTPHAVVRRSAGPIPAGETLRTNAATAKRHTSGLDEPPETSRYMVHSTAGMLRRRGHAILAGLMVVSTLRQWICRSLNSARAQGQARKCAEHQV